MNFVLVRLPVCDLPQGMLVRVLMFQTSRCPVGLSLSLIVFHHILESITAGMPTLRFFPLPAGRIISSDQLSKPMILRLHSFVFFHDVFLQLDTLLTNLAQFLVSCFRLWP